jgi:hypothetical protein
MSDELAPRFHALARAIDNVLVSAHGLLHSLKAPPAFGSFVDGLWHPAPIQDGVARYGEGPLFALWVHCRDLVALRVAWTGHPGITAAPAEPSPEPDEAPGLAIEASPELGTENQQRLAGA